MQQLLLLAHTSAHFLALQVLPGIILTLSACDLQKISGIASMAGSTGTIMFSHAIILRAVLAEARSTAYADLHAKALPERAVVEVSS